MERSRREAEELESRDANAFQGEQLQPAEVEEAKSDLGAWGAQFRVGDAFDPTRK